MAMPKPYRLSVRDYELMIKEGILTENDQVELIRGEILKKMAIGDPHTACVKRMNRLFGARLAPHALLSIQDPIVLATSEPEPDVALLKLRSDCYATGKPTAADVLLLIEVADTSLDYDRSVKRPLYAEAGITEYWIANLLDQVIEVHRLPDAVLGTYQHMEILARGQQVEALAFPGEIFQVNDLL
jgi:Uma2 family endonuclease